MTGTRPVDAPLRILTALLLASSSLQACGDSGPEEDLIGDAIASGRVAAFSNVEVPAIPGIEAYIVDNDSAAALGKALFWEMRVGNNGQACASCHFHAGADRRITNVIHPGNRDVAVFDGDDALLATVGSGESLFQGMASGGLGGPNYTLVEDDFPFHQKEDPQDRDSAVVFDSDDLVGSQGVFNAEFATTGLDGVESCVDATDGVFEIDATRTRRVTPRNTPTTINAALNHRNFWDGRANQIFNGVNPFGRRAPGATVMRVPSAGAVPEAATVRLENSSLASQAVGPPLSGSEMSCGANGTNRTFAHIGRKLLGQLALADQAVHPNDSLLASYRASGDRGLNRTYGEWVEEAFDPQWWQAPADWTSCGEGTTPTSSPDCFTLAETNFSLFWGLAIQAYERTLVSDETRFDIYVRERKAGMVSTALTEEEERGLLVFVGEGRCSTCHTGAGLSSATITAVSSGAGAIDRRDNADDALASAVHDQGFFNIGIRPSGEGDSGVGLRQHPESGVPLSFAAQYVEGILDRDFAAEGGTLGQGLLPDPCAFTNPVGTGELTGSSAAACADDPEFVSPEFGVDDLSSLRVSVADAFKVPSLRNVDLTGPYMHNGSMATLEQVVSFYNRGGNFESDDLAADMQPLELSEEQRTDLIAFLGALTDERVRYDRAPFDHPELVIAHGHGGNESALDCASSIQLMDVDPLLLIGTCSNMEVIPAIGADGAPEPMARPFIDFLRAGR